VIDKGMVETRRTALVQQRDDLIGQVNACLGAIQDCEYWITQIEAQASKTQGDEVARQPLDLSVLSAPTA
jgi:hypothetical protein